jgi:hypothetical protein
VPALRRGAAEQHVKGGVVGGKAGVAAAGRVLEQHLGDVGDEVGDEPAHDHPGEGQTLLEGAKEVEGQRLAGEQVGPQTLGVDDGADLAVGDLVLHQWDQRGVDEVDAAGRPTRVDTMLPRRRLRPSGGV